MACGLPAGVLMHQEAITRTESREVAGGRCCEPTQKAGIRQLPHLHSHQQRGSLVPDLQNSSRRSTQQMNTV